MVRVFLLTVSLLAWIAALAVAWFYAESAGILAFVAAGMFALVAVIALGCERILKLLTEIRDSVAAPAAVSSVSEGEQEVEVDAPLGARTV
jgi:hypothetical protein